MRDLRQQIVDESDTYAFVNYFSASAWERACVALTYFHENFLYTLVGEEI